MGNDNKIKKTELSTGKEVMLFLGDELEPLRRSKRVKVYDLETEYAKTKNNKLWAVWITLIATLAAVILITILTTKLLSSNNEKIEVNLSSFADLNLLSLFDQVSRVQEKYDEASKRRAEIKGNLDARINQAKMKMDSDLELMSANRRLSRAEINARRKQIEDDYNSQVSAAHSDYDASLAAAEAEVEQYAEQLKAYDSNNIAQNSKIKDQIDSERQVHQLEKQRLIQSYEEMLEASRKELDETRIREFEDRKNTASDITRRYEAEIDTYDPVIRDEKITGILAQAEQLAVGEKYSAEPFIESEPKLSNSFSGALRQIQENYEDLNTLYNQSASIPNRNTMKNVVAAERKLSVNVANDLTTAAIDEIRAKDREISILRQQLHITEDQRDVARATSESYEGILNSNLFDEKTAGFVINMEGKYGLAIFIRGSFVNEIVRDGSTKVEIYNGRVKVSTGTVLYAEDSYYITLDKESDKSKIAVGYTFKIVNKK